MRQHLWAMVLICRTRHQEAEAASLAGAAAQGSKEAMSSAL